MCVLTGVYLSKMLKEAHGPSSLVYIVGLLLPAIK